MIEVYQTDLRVPGGNCLPACIASILEIPMDEIPNFCNEYPDDWFSAFAAWCLRRRHGASYSKIDNLALVCPGYCIIGVRHELHKPEHPQWIHAVVGEILYHTRPPKGHLDVRVEVVFDPHPKRPKILELLDVIQIVRPL